MANYNPISESVSAVILAGGRATRMGGDDKGLLSIQDNPMVAHIAIQLKKQCDNLYINANRNLDKYQQFVEPDHVFSDAMHDYQGPLAGMLSAIQQVPTDWLITAPCDGPFIAPDYIGRMYNQAQTTNCKIAVARDSERIQPVYCLLHISVADSLRDFLHSGERKIDKWFAMHQFTQVGFSDCREMFYNINTPENLAEISTKFPKIMNQLNA